MKILITGSKGQLGMQIEKDFSRFIKNKNLKLFPMSKNDFDITDNLKCEEIILNLRPDWVINCAAYTNVEQAEIHKEEAEKVNIIGPRNLAKVIKKINSKILHISTDYVFNGNQRIPYKTVQEKSPLNFYGYTKSEGEDILIEILEKNSVILRTGWLYGSYGKNFLLTMLNLHNIKSKKGEIINVIDDQIGSPTSTSSISEICWRIIKNENDSLPNIFHWSNKGEISWYEFAVSIKKFAIKNKILNEFTEIKPIKSSELDLNAIRPKYSVLDCVESSKNLNLNLISYEEKLKEVLKNLKNLDFYI